MIILNRKQLEGVALLHQQQVVAWRDGQGRKFPPFYCLGQQLGLACGVEEADDAVLVGTDEAFAKVLGSQQIHSAITLEITDLGELTFAILCHFKPLGDDAVVITYQQRRSACQQLDPGHVGVGGIDLQHVAQGDFAQVMNVIDGETISLTYKEDPQIGGQQHLIHMTRQRGNRVVFTAPLNLPGDEVLLAAHHSHHATTIFGHGSGRHLVLGGFEHHPLQRLPLRVDHHRLFAEGIFQAGFNHPHIVGIGDLERRLDNQCLAIGKAVGNQLLARRRRCGRADVASNLGLAQ